MTPVKKAIAKGTAPPSFVRDVLLHDATKYTGTDVETIYIAMSTIAAGSDNPRMAMSDFLMAALCYPDIMQKARDEVGKVCSHAERLPCFGDMAELPYVCALVKEGQRWRPTVPLIPQHQLTEDLEFEGFLFPTETEFVGKYLGTAVTAVRPIIEYCIPMMSQERRNLRTGKDLHISMY